MKRWGYLLLMVNLTGFVTGCESNDPPVIEQIIVPEIIEPGVLVEFEVIARDSDDDALKYTWRINDTRLEETTPRVTWRAPSEAGTITVEVRVADGENEPIIQRKVITIGKSLIEVPDVIPAVDLSKHTVPLDEVFFDTFRATNRAVPLDKATADLIEELRDAIPPIHDPKYETASEADWLTDDDVVIGYAAGGRAWVYPVRILSWHEIVNDTLAGEPTLVSFCPLCFSGIVFSRLQGNRVLTFGNTSALYESDMVMLDYETGSYWWQVAGQAIVGTLAGEVLTVLPSVTTTWEKWKQLYPETQVLSRDTGFSRSYGFDPFTGYAETVNRGGFVFPVSEAGRDGRLNAGEKVLAVKVGNDARAYPIEILGLAAINDTVGGDKIVVLTDGSGGSAFEPLADGQEVTFTVQNQQFVDRKTGSTWDMAGRAIAGALKGTQLSALPTKTSFWFSIVAAEPRITVHQR